MEQIKTLLCAITLFLGGVMLLSADLISLSNGTIFAPIGIALGILGLLIMFYDMLWKQK